MIRETFNYDWAITPNRSIQTLMNTEEPVKVTLPYDDMLTHKRSPEASSKDRKGYFPEAMLTMNKKFHAPEEWEEKIITFEFEGVYSDSRVYINGDYAGGCPNGYTNFYVSAEKFLVPGQDNEIKVISKARKDSRWYTGVGIYRNVKLMVGNPIHVIPDSYHILTPEVDQAGAVVEITCSVSNKLFKSRETKIVTRLLDDNEHVVAESSDPLTVFSNEQSTLHQRLYIKNHKCWDIDTPYLYTAKTEVYVGDQLVDEEKSAFGIRTLQLDPVNGLRINGNIVKLRGACVHHDNGIIGAANIDRAEERRVELLKKAGFNAIRSAHNPISKAFLNACDKYGLVVMDEFSDIWERSKDEDDYAGAFPYHWEEAIKAMVNKDYNHPSVIMYSIGNEIAETGSAHGAAIGRKLADKIRSMDESRYVINSVNYLNAVLEKMLPMFIQQSNANKKPGDINEAMTDFGALMAQINNSEIATKDTMESFSYLDIAGYNYADERYISDREKFPNRVICGSETLPAKIGKNWKIISENSHVIGDFTWTGWDYLGEAGIGRMAYKEDDISGGFYGHYPWYIAYCGDFDIIGNRRPMSYFREIVFGLRKEPYIAVRRPQNYGKTLIPRMWDSVDGISSWTWNGFEGKPVEVEVYADAEKVELECNGIRSDAVKVEDYKAVFTTTYQPGELVAIAYKSDVEVGRTILRTAESNLNLKVEVDRKIIRADDTDLAYIMISLTDDLGNVNTAISKKVSVQVGGAGYLLGMGSADPTSEESFLEGEFTTFEGYVLAVVRPNEKGDIKVTIVANELLPQTITISAE